MNKEQLIEKLELIARQLFDEGKADSAKIVRKAIEFLMEWPE